VREPRKEPLKIEEWQCDLDKKKFGPKFKKDGKTVEAAIEALSQDLREKLSLDLEKEGKIVIDVPGVGDGKVEVPKELITIEKRTRVENVREYTPNVIEPSFGIGRIFYVSLTPETLHWTITDVSYRLSASTHTGLVSRTKHVVCCRSLPQSPPQRFSLCH
jgi:glycyl-tRNA synthetase